VVLVKTMNLHEKGFETILHMTLKSVNRRVKVMFSSAPGSGTNVFPCVWGSLEYQSITFNEHVTNVHARSLEMTSDSVQYNNRIQRRKKTHTS